MPEIDFDAETAPDAWDALNGFEPELAGRLRIRVRVGAALFDAARPRWERAVRLDALAMETGDRDVLAQVFGGCPGCALATLTKPLMCNMGTFHAASFGLNLASVEQQCCGDPDCRNPHCTTEAAVDARFDALTALWVREARSRMDAGRGEVAGA